jgi:hypothetical protein
MQSLLATPRIFHAIGTNPGSDSANFPSNISAAMVCPRAARSGWFTAGLLGSDSGSGEYIVGQSNVQGAHPPG